MTYGSAVLEVHQAWLGPGIAIFMLVTMTYLAGRVHQFFKQTVDREAAYRDGYNTATRSLFALATRTAKGQYLDTRVRPEVKPQRGYASVPHESLSPLPARHRAEGRRKSNAADTHKFEDWPVPVSKAA